MSQIPSLPEDIGADSRLALALQEYLAALEAGSPPRREEFLTRYPDIAAELARDLDGLEALHAASMDLHGLARYAGARTGLAWNDGQPVLALGDYQILREVGRGGMGIVYEARQLSLGRRVALKVLPLATALDERQRRRFEHEAQTAAGLHHSNVVPIYGVGHERGVHYYAMQYIEGQSLADFLRALRRQAGKEDDPHAAPSGASLLVAELAVSTPREPCPAPLTIPDLSSSTSVKDGEYGVTSLPGKESTVTDQGYFQAFGKEFGPFSATELKRMVREGWIKAATPVRKSAGGKWVPASKVKGLLHVEARRVPKTSQSHDDIPTALPADGPEEEVCHPGRAPARQRNRIAVPVPPPVTPLAPTHDPASNMWKIVLGVGGAVVVIILLGSLTGGEDFRPGRLEHYPPVVSHRTLDNPGEQPAWERASSGG